jgi:DNA-binding SARP family transcriptional activator/tetratricopeptide (TPR) repeat protein
VIRLVTLGSLQLNGDAGPLLAGRRKILALLACLLRRAPDHALRSELAVLLWTDRRETQAKQSLRQALAELRPIFGDALLADADAVLLDPDACWFDARVFEEAVRDNRYDDAARLWGGDFLTGLDTVGGEAWTVWLTEERNTLRQAAATVFRAQYEATVQRDDRKAAMDWSQRWCDVAPLDEPAHSARVQALVRAGRPVDAAVSFEGFVRRLHNEKNVSPSPAFEALRALFSAGRAVPADKVVIRGTVTISGLSQLGGDARAIAEAAAVIEGVADAATLQAISHITSFSFKFAIAELVQHGILAPSGEGKWEFTSQENRDRVLSVISRHRRENLERAAAERLGIPLDQKRTTPTRTLVTKSTPAKPAPKVTIPTPSSPARASSAKSSFRPRMLVAAGLGAIAIVAAANWAARVATAGSVELEPGSTVLLQHVSGASDPALAGAVNTAAALGLSQSRHVALYKPAGRDTATGAPNAAGTQALAKRERIQRIIALDVTGTDSALRVAARLIDGSSGEVLGEESIETGRASLVDDLDRLLRKVRVTLGEPEEIVRDSSRLLREVGSASIEALSAYAEGLEAYTADQADRARAAWARALVKDSAFALAELALANDAFNRSDAEEGDRWVRRAITHAERLTAVDALRARQMVALRDKRYSEASALAEQVIKRAPSSQAWVDLAHVHVAAGKCTEAVTAFERAVAADSTNTRAHLGIAGCALADGNTAVALKSLDEARRADSSSISWTEYELYRGQALARAGRFSEADTAFRAMLSGGSADSATSHRWVALSLMMRGRYGEALPILSNVTRLVRQAGDAQELFDVLVLEASAFTAIGGRTKASELIDEAVGVATSRPLSVTGYFHLGHLMARVGRLNGAREILRQASLRTAQQNDPTSQWAVRLLTASVNLAERNAPEALTALEATGAPAELEPFRLALVADAYALAGRHDAALEAARKLSSGWYFGDGAQDEWLRSTLRIARVSELAGDTATARTTYRKFVDRWKDADVFLVELSMAQRSLVRLGGNPMASAGAVQRGR